MKKNKFLQNFNFKSKKVLVLGGSGLIGKGLVENYISLGAKVRILDIKNVFKNGIYCFAHKRKNDMEALMTPIEICTATLKNGKP